MTLVAAFSIERVPVLFGDLLITGPSSAERKVSIPVMREAQDFFGKSGWSISGLSQKVNLVGPNCAIAWSGSWLGARIAISELARRAKLKDLEVSEILEYLHEEPELKVHPASFVGLVLSAGRLQKFFCNAEEFESPSLGRVFVCGSGTPAMREFSDLMPQFQFRVNAAMNPLEAAVYRALTLGGMLLRAEMHGGYGAPTLLNMFGGGYEIAYDAGGRIQKLPEVTYVIWLATVSPGGVAAAPQMIIAQRYVGEYLLLRSARLGSKDGVPTIADDQRHVIKPMFESNLDVPLRALDHFSLQSALYCHCILVQNDGAEIDIIYTMIRPTRPDSRLPMTFQDEAGNFRLGIEKDLMDEIEQSVSKAVGEVGAG